MYFLQGRSITNILWSIFSAPFVLFFGVSMLIMAPVYMFGTALSSWSRLMFFRIITRTAVPLLAGFLDSIPTWLVMIWWLPDYYKSHIAQDGRPCLEGIAVGELHLYAEKHPRETVQALTPWGSDVVDSTSQDLVTPEVDSTGRWFQQGGPRHVLYIHGGGFLAANAVLLMPSVTPFVRAGYTVWCINYPLSPESQHPAAIVSVLRALHWLRTTRNVSRIIIIGDSAGGQLATTAAAFCDNPHLLEDLKNGWRHTHFRSYHPDEIEHWRFPAINGVVSLYGVLDSVSWACKSKRLSELSWLENKLSQFGLELCTWSYCKHPDPVLMDGKRFFCDFIQQFRKYPRTLMVCGTLDILVHSSRRATNLLQVSWYPAGLVNPCLGTWIRVCDERV
eukprot:TRINITY_DN1957_c0_g1_i1.p1 TRINITY_DN1957_c0_g1~~TRINITY_DN1957_c0_g1_i1.p1  ORF type:complete len:391 (+),score=29.39 TRINITY_DN1957_c0_g1_i1:145-1317(+)